MKNFILLMLVIFTGQISFAQLYAENSSFIFSKGTNVFVKRKVKLEAGTFFYLRGEAQLLQNDDVANEGAGILSLYQEGTSNQYTYNYWSSPVSKQDTGIDGNVGFRRTQLMFPITGGGTILDNFSRAAGMPTFLEAPQYNGRADNGTTRSPLLIAGFWINNYDSSGNNETGYAGWIRLQNDASTLAAGYGFTMKGSSTFGNHPNFREFNGAIGQRYDLRGRANNGTVSMGVANDNSTLVGNPYPSALDVKKFLETNAQHVSGNDVKIDPEAQFWESQQEFSHLLINYNGGYGIYTPLGFEPGNENGYANSGTYTSPLFRRTDNDGNYLTQSNVSGGDVNTAGGRRYAAIGQGFFIQRTNSIVEPGPNAFERSATPFITDGVVIGSDNGTNIIGENVIFNNTMRLWVKENGASSIFKSGDSDTNVIDPFAAKDLPTMIINVVHLDTYVRPLQFIFDPSTSLDYDYAWEAQVIGRASDDAYIIIEDGEYSLSSQAYDESMRIPVGVQVDGNEPKIVEFELAQLVEFDPANIYVHDTYNGVYYNIKDGNHRLLLQPGHYTDRFEITFTNTTLSNSTFDLTNVEIYQDNKLKLLSVLNPEMKDVKKISLFDLAGRLVIEVVADNIENNYTIGTQAFATGIYVAKVTTNDDYEKTVKVSIAN
jgi:hypothetical protein